MLGVEVQRVERSVDMSSAEGRGRFPIGSNWQSSCADLFCEVVGVVAFK